MASIASASAAKLHRAPVQSLWSANKASILLGLLLVVATIVVYAPVRHFPFLNWDDNLYVEQNSNIQHGLDWQTVKWAFTTYDIGYWHPLTWLSHALDVQLFYLNPARHHEMNLLLHVLNVLLLFWMLKRATGSVGRSFIVAALFALHPVNVESVAWIAERKNLLSMLFFLLALGAYEFYARRPRVDRYLVVAALFALGLMAKPQIVTFPCVLLLWDYWPLRRMRLKADEHTAAPQEIPPRSIGRLVLEKLPLLALSAASSVATAQAERLVGTVNNPLNSFSLTVRLENAVVSYALYIRNAFWPSRLAALYPYLGDSVTRGQVVSAVVFLLAVTALAIRYGRTHRYLLVGWFWFLGTLVPMIGLIQVGSQGMADRFGYLSFIGLFIMITWGVADWAAWIGKPVLRRGVAVLSMAVLLVLAALTYRQIGYWKDDLTLWSRAVQVTSNNWEAEMNLGVTLMRAGQVEEAMPHLRNADSQSPSNPTIIQYLGDCEQASGNPRAAIARYQQVLQLTQNDFQHWDRLRTFTWSAMAAAYRALGDLPQAYAASDQARAETRRAIARRAKTDEE